MILHDSALVLKIGHGFGAVAHKILGDAIIILAGVFELHVAGLLLSSLVIEYIDHFICIWLFRVMYLIGELIDNLIINVYLIWLESR